jgi:hypothetical protein
MVQGLTVFLPNAELYFERGNSMKFTSLVRELESAGTLTQSKVSAVWLFYY